VGGITVRWSMADSLVDGVFEETQSPIEHEGDLASIKLMGLDGVVGGMSASIARVIKSRNAQPDRRAGLGKSDLHLGTLHSACRYYQRLVRCPTVFGCARA